MDDLPGDRSIFPRYELLALSMEDWIRKNCKDGDVLKVAKLSQGFAVMNDRAGMYFIIADELPRAAP